MVPRIWSHPEMASGHQHRDSSHRKDQRRRKRIHFVATDPGHDGATTTQLPEAEDDPMESDSSKANEQVAAVQSSTAEARQTHWVAGRTIGSAVQERVNPTDNDSATAKDEGSEFPDDQKSNASDCQDQMTFAERIMNLSVILSAPPLDILKTLSVPDVPFSGAHLFYNGNAHRDAFVEPNEKESSN
ncbi:hypothetical protein FI667_g17338, partial [Globisporangium splendens]